MSALVSVIIPCYNQAQYLPEALEAILAQTYTNWECIIVNDGSPDNSKTIALNYCSKDSRFIYLEKENGGLSSARNAGLKIAKGYWIQFLDSDDYIEPEKLKLSMDMIAEDPSASIIVSDFKMFVNHPTDATPAFCELKQECLNFDSILYGWDVEFNIPIHSGLFKASLFAGNYFIESLKSNEDWVMWLSIFKNDIKAYYLNYPLVYYRINPNSMTKDKAFVRYNLAESFKYILKTLQHPHAVKFACNIIDRYQSVIACNENDLEYFKNGLPYRAERKLKNTLKKVFSLKKRIN